MEPNRKHPDVYCDRWMPDLAAEIVGDLELEIEAQNDIAMRAIVSYLSRASETYRAWQRAARAGDSS